VLRLLFGLPLLLALLLPLVASLIEVSPVFGDGVAMLAFLHHPQFGGALLLSLSTGTAATLLSLVFAILIVMSGGGRSGAQAGVLLAVPHLALACHSSLRPPACWRGFWHWGWGGPCRLTGSRCRTRVGWR
jgi:hypothetical protein